MPRLKNARREKYCQLRADGKCRADAMKEAGFDKNGCRETARNHSYQIEWEKNPKTMDVINRIRELKEKAEQGQILDRQARQSLLTEMALDETAAKADRLRATDILNRMCGDYDDHVSITGSVSVEQIRKEAWEKMMES